MPVPRPPVAGPAPAVLRWTAVCWALAVAAGGTALVAAAADLEGSRARLTATAAQQDPQASAAVLRSGVATTLLLPTGAVLLALLLGTGCVVALLGRRSWARWVTGVLALTGCVGSVLSGAVLSGGPPLDGIAFGVCAVALAAVAALLPVRTTGRWLSVGR